MRLIGTVGSDWLRKQGVVGGVSDEVLRSWRDYFEDRLKEVHGIDADLSIGKETRFSFLGSAERHTITEIEDFARKSLDRFLSRETNRR